MLQQLGLLFLSSFILQNSRLDIEKTANTGNTAAGVNNNNAKDDITCLIHLYKFLGAQIPWTNYYGVMS